jgi:ATP synthase protein I
MNDLKQHMQNVFRSALFFMAACFLVWAVAPGLRPYASGLLLGTVISLINARILSYKIEAITVAALANDGRKQSAGFISRACMVLIGTMVSMRFPDFHLVSTIIGFFFVQMATLFMGFLFIFQKKTT